MCIPHRRVGYEDALFRALKEKRILVRFFDKPGLQHMVRITIGRRDENDALLAALPGS